jgi:large subunit ribosomal protein L4
MSEQVDVFNTAGENTGQVSLVPSLFAERISEYALHRSVVSYETNQRQGNASTKTRSEVNRTGKKHHRQKGTGMARRGSLRSPLVRGGGVAFGPHPRNYDNRMPKKLKRLALGAALTLKNNEGQIRIIEDFELPEPSTKSFVNIIKSCGLENTKVLFVTPKPESNLIKSSRNIPGVSMTHTGTLGAYDLLRVEIIVFTRQALIDLEAHFDANKAVAPQEGSGE